jgi:SAM-dependent methyltransferase
MPFQVPPKFLRNAPDVLEIGPPAQVALTLVDHIARRIGRRDWAGLEVLDIGCGTRFADMFMTQPAPVGSYTGIDIDQEMVAFLQAEATDPRLRFLLFDAYNFLYHRKGTPMTPQTRLPVGDARFDLLVAMSVFTHQVPQDALSLLTILRRHVRPDGHLFFTAYLDPDAAVEYYEYKPEVPGALSCYHPATLARLLEQTGWRVVTGEPPGVEDLPMLDSFACVPA